MRKDAGIIFEPEDVGQLVAGLRRLSADPSLCERYRSNALKAAQQYDRSALASQMLSALRSVVER
jgi:hypothetical protein